MMDSDINILLVDDHNIFAESLVKVIENSFAITKVTSVDLALKYLKTSFYNIVITDIEMPNKNGVYLVKEINKKHNTIKCIVLTSHTDPKLFKDLMDLNISAYLSKNTSKIELLQTIRLVSKNQKYFSPDVYEHYLKNKSSLAKKSFSPRELDVLKLIMEEKTTKQIAEYLGVSIYTVEDYRKKLLIKTNATNVVGLVKYAIMNNLL